MTTSVVTLLVTDLVGSTALRVRTGEDRFDEIRAEHDHLLRDQVRLNTPRSASFRRNAANGSGARNCCGMFSASHGRCFSATAPASVAGTAAVAIIIARNASFSTEESLWLFLAVHSWRLIASILMTLGLGLMLTLLFAAAAVGTNGDRATLTPATAWANLPPS